MVCVSACECAHVTEWVGVIVKGPAYLTHIHTCIQFSVQPSSFRLPDMFSLFFKIKRFLFAFGGEMKISVGGGGGGKKRI